MLAYRARNRALVERQQPRDHRPRQPVAQPQLVKRVHAWGTLLARRWLLACHTALVASIGPDDFTVRPDVTEATINLLSVCIPVE